MGVPRCGIGGQGGQLSSSQAGALFSRRLGGGGKSRVFDPPLSTHSTPLPS